MSRSPDNPRVYLLKGRMPDPATRLPLNPEAAGEAPAGAPALFGKVAAAAASLAALPSERSFDEQLLDSLLGSFAADSAAIVTRHEAFKLQVRTAKRQQGSTYIPAELVYQALDEYAAVAVPWMGIPRTEDDPHGSAGCAFLCAPMGPPRARTCVVCLRTWHAGFSEDDVHALVALLQLAESIRAMSRRLNRFERLYQAEVDGRGPKTMLVGQGQSSRSLMTRIAEIAPLPTPVLIRGEPGTGKEMVARAIHENSTRRGEPFVVADCRERALSLDVILWGTEPGIFTGSRPRGSAELADGGTLFVDAVDAMPFPEQGQLLRLLREHEIYRRGSTSGTSVDVRVIAATTRDLSASVNEGTFRKDLYLRLKAIQLHVAPLRERRTEITSLAYLFLGGWRRDRPLTISDAALRCLNEYDWPHNVRELEQVIARGAMVAFTDRIEPEDLPEALRENVTSLGAWAEAGSLHRAVLQAKMQAVTEAWRTARGAHAEAARILGVTEGYLRRLVRQAGLEEESLMTPPSMSADGSPANDPPAGAIDD